VPLRLVEGQRAAQEARRPADDPLVVPDRDRHPGEQVRERLRPSLGLVLAVDGGTGAMKACSRRSTRSVRP